MKVTFTADDGNNFENEADCLGWEKFTKLREESIETLTDPDDPESWDQELHSFMLDIAGENGSWFGGMSGIWRSRKHLYRMVELMKRAEAG